MHQIHDEHPAAGRTILPQGNLNHLRTQGCASVVLALTMFGVISGFLRAEIPKPTDAPPPLSPTASAANMKLPEGLAVELIASEPLIAEPSCVAFDERGRIFVSELHGYNLEGQLDIDELNKAGKLDTEVRRVRVSHEAFLKARQQMRGVIKLLKDTDNDGRFDAVDVWCDDLPPCYGIVPARGGIIATCAPHIVYLADRDGDGRAEVREILFTGFTVTVMERAINNPRWGPDNWIYVGEGGGGGTITGPKLKQPFRLGETDFRIKPDGSAIEAVNGSVGTFGMAVGDFGDRFIANGGRPADYALPLPYRYLARNPHVSTPPTTVRAVEYTNVFRISQPHPWRVRRAEDARWVKFYGEKETSHHYFSGGCGNELYRAKLLGDEYRDNLFFCDPSQNVVHRCVLARDGAAWRGSRARGLETAEFLASADSWFSPVNSRVGPDGALYIVDIYREIIEDYSAIPRHLQQEYGLMNGADRGRLWRLAPKDTHRQAFEDLTKRNNAELVSLLDTDEAWWRLTAQRMLVERNDASIAEQLRPLVREGKTAQGRLAALYTLDGLGQLQAGDVLAALEDGHDGVRFNALDLGSRWLKTDVRLRHKTTSMVDDGDPRVRLYVAMVLGEAPGESSTAALAQLAKKHTNDQWMAAAILSSSSSTAGDLLALLLQDVGETQAGLTLVSLLAATVGGEGDPQQLLQLLQAITTQRAAVQRAALSGLLSARARGKTAPVASAELRAAVESLLANSAGDVREQAVRLAARSGVVDSPSIEAVFALAKRQALDNDSKPEDRCRALSLLADASFEDLAGTATQLLDARQPPTVQLAAVAALSSADDPRVGDLLAKGWKGYTPDLRRAVLDALFAQSNRLPALLTAVEQKAIRPGELDDFRRQQLLKHSDARIAARAAALLKRDSNDRELAERFARYTAALDGERKPALGREVFLKHCAACHQIGDEGHTVGPPLAPRLVRPDQSLLIDLLDPSREIASGFQSYTVITIDGRVYSGVLESDSPTGVTLRREMGQRAEILRKDIESIAASELSLMSSNLHEHVSPEDAAHLLAYLRTALAAPQAPGAKETPP
jgi:putative membrane-bound dehydrogenase-like protein